MFLWGSRMYKMTFSLLLICYVHLIIRPAKNPRGDEVINFLPIQYQESKSTFLGYQHKALHSHSSGTRE